MHPVVFVSLGPGEADLITLKGFKALQSADCIFYPSTIIKGMESSRALNILTELGIDAIKLKSFLVPMSKDRSLAIDAYIQTSNVIEQYYNEGLKVAVVAEGDSGFYSSIHYICDYLAEKRVAMKHIAGIPAFIACGALAGIHIVKQEEELNVVPGIITKDDLLQKIESNKTVVIMKTSQCEAIVKQAIEEKSDTTFHYFENAGVQNKEYYTQNKEDILSRKFPYFSLMIIHN